MELFNRFKCIKTHLRIFGNLLAVDESISKVMMLFFQLIRDPINSGSLEEHCQHLNILCLSKLYSFSVGKFMHSYHNKLLPNHFDEYFVPLSSIHYIMDYATKNFLCRGWDVFWIIFGRCIRIWRLVSPAVSIFQDIYNIIYIFL